MGQLSESQLAQLYPSMEKATSSPPVPARPGADPYEALYPSMRRSPAPAATPKPTDPLWAKVYPTMAPKAESGPSLRRSPAGCAAKRNAMKGKPRGNRSRARIIHAATTGACRRPVRGAGLRGERLRIQLASEEGRVALRGCPKMVLNLARHVKCDALRREALQQSGVALGMRHNLEAIIRTHHSTSLMFQGRALSPEDASALSRYALDLGGRRRHRTLSPTRSRTPSAS
jgi:hypothetical protein